MPKNPPPPPEPTAKELMKALEQCFKMGKGRRHTEVFSDWLAVTEASMRMAPAQISSLRLNGEVLEYPEPIKELWQRVNKWYGPEIFMPFREAMQVLWEHASSLPHKEWTDILGPTYMEIGANKDAGQFFTPMSVARMMAMMQVDEGLVYERIREALGPGFDYSDRRGMWDALVNMVIADKMRQAGKGALLESELQIPADTPSFPYITVMDPAVGSGVMLVGAASCFPRWAVEMGLVQFYGMDIDIDCTRMAQINCYLYGLNGYGLQMLGAIGSSYYPRDEDVRWDLLSEEAWAASILVKAVEDSRKYVEQLEERKEVVTQAATLTLPSPRPTENVDKPHKPVEKPLGKVQKREDNGKPVQMGFDFDVTF
jgi:hypothetical protein